MCLELWMLLNAIGAAGQLGSGMLKLSNDAMQRMYNKQQATGNWQHAAISFSFSLSLPRRTWKKPKLN